MQRFHFRLERVLQWKAQRERQAEIQQQEAQLALAAAEREVQDLTAQLTQTAQTLAAQIGHPVAISSWLAHQDHSAQIRQTLEAAEARVGLAVQQLQEAEARRTGIALEVEALRTLRRQQWQAFQEEAARAEQTRLDEVGLRRWQAAQRGEAFGAQARKDG